MSYLRQFSEVGRDDVDLAGGKGANLGELTCAGLPVPNGFLLTTDAYRAFVQAAGIGAAIQELEVAISEESRLGSSAEQIRALFTGRSIPADLRAEISAGYAQLGEKVPVAVRSSATARRLGRRELRRPAGDVPQHPWIGPGPGGCARVLGIVVDRASHRLSPAARR